MKTYNFYKRLDVATKIALDKWAKRLEAEEMTIHKDGSVSLYCKYGCICENYMPTREELYKINEKTLSCDELLNYYLMTDCII